MRKNLFYLLFIVFAGVACSKSSNLEPGEQPGILKITYTPNLVQPASDSLMVVIEASDGKVVSSFSSLSKIPSEGITLPAGSYKVNAKPTNKRIPLFEREIYESSSTADVTASGISTATMKLKPQTFGITISYSTKFKSEYKNYYAVVSSPEGSLTYNGTTISKGCFISGPIGITVYYTDAQGSPQTLKESIAANSPSIQPGATAALEIKHESEYNSIPQDYYLSANGKTGVDLKKELTKIITTGFVSQSYNALWDAYVKGDIRTDGTNAIWDIYSDNPTGSIPYLYQPVQNQCGNYSKEGDCYNREHTIPKSWFNDDSPMYSDYLHILPTDGYVNGKRSNYPYGEVESVSWTSKNGSKLGSAKSTLGYSGTVFEPIDTYKGDIARIYFYFVTRYADKLKAYDVNNSSSEEIFNANDYGLDKWVIDMMLRWHAADPVSRKEMIRNQAAQTHQKNRNPYVDHPEYVEKIWGKPSL